MAQVSCPECGGTISSYAQVCPHCGRPLRGFVQCPKCGSTNVEVRSDGARMLSSFNIFGDTKHYICHNCGKKF